MTPGLRKRPLAWVVVLSTASAGADGAPLAAGAAMARDRAPSTTPAVRSKGAEPVGSWPGFRGPNRDGVSAETGLVASWPEGGPPVLWRIAAGSGYSGVAVHGDRAFTLWQDGSGQHLVALAVADGGVLWKHTVGPPFASPYGDGPRSTPVVAGGRVFAIDAHGTLVAVRTGDGKRIWSHDLERELGARIPSIGYASTPLVEDERLLVEVGAERGAFMAFDTATGAVAWSSQSDEPAYSSPLALTAGETRQVVFLSASGLHALAPADGRLLWRHPWSSPCPSTGIPLNSATPVFIPPDRVFVSSAYGDRRGGAVLRLVGRGHRLEVEELWHTRNIDSKINTAVLIDDTLYGFKGAILVSVDAATGELRWSSRGFGRGSLIAADGRLIALAEDGRLALVEADPGEFREVASARILSGRTWTPPALAAGRLFARNGEEVVAVDLADRGGRARATR